MKYRHAGVANAHGLIAFRWRGLGITEELGQMFKKTWTNKEECMIKLEEYQYDPGEAAGLFTVAHLDNQYSEGRYVTSVISSEEIIEVYSHTIRESYYSGTPRKLIGKIVHFLPGYLNMDNLVTVEEIIEAYERTGSGPGELSGKWQMANLANTESHRIAVYTNPGRVSILKVIRELAILELRAFGYIKNGHVRKIDPMPWKSSPD